MNVVPDEALLVRTFEDYVRRLESGERPDPREYADSLGPTFPFFLDAVEAQEALEDLIEPTSLDEMPEMVGPYTVVRPLGRGALGVVYEARHRRLDRRVALKLLHGVHLDDEGKVARFRREARLCAHVRHPHLVGMLDAGRIGNRPYCAMELVEGRSLKQVLREAPLPATRALFEQFAGLADGLAHMHAAGIVHRDVKPSNIMVDQGGRYVLTDFGLARAELDASITQTGQTLGTMPYMAPEHLAEKRSEQVGPADGRSDTYALGVTLYEALAGAPPFQGGSLASLMAAVRTQRPVPLREAAPGVPAAVSAVVMKAIERDPRDRYASAEALRDDLLRLARGAPVAGRPVGRVRRALRKVRRRLPAIAAVLILGFGAAWWWTHRPATLELRPCPAASVRLDGALVGRSPLVLELAPGDHHVRLDAHGFRSHEVTLHLDPGATQPLGPCLLPLDRNDRTAVGLLLDALERQVPDYRDPTHRGAPTPPPVRPILPRGRVRLADLVTLRLETSPLEEVPAAGRWVVLRGEEVLFEEAAHLAQFRIERPFPAAARERLRPGDRFRWGLVADAGQEFTAECEVAAPDLGLEAALARTAGLLAQPEPGLEAYLRSELLRAAGLPSAAFEVLEAARQDEPAALVLGAEQRLLVQLELEDSLLFEALTRRIKALPDDVRQAWFR